MTDDTPHTRLTQTLREAAGETTATLAAALAVAEADADQDEASSGYSGGHESPSGPCGPSALSQALTTGLRHE